MRTTGFEFYRTDDSNGWVINHDKDLKYPMFNHPEVNEEYSQEQLKEACDMVYIEMSLLFKKES